jgi:putative transposase
MNWRVWVDKKIQLFYEAPIKYSTDKGAHSVYCSQFNLVFCVKYRLKVITDEISDYLKKTVIEISKKYGIKVIEQETDLDHIHLLFCSKPSITLSVFINSLKSVTSRLIRKNFPEVSVTR